MSPMTFFEKVAQYFSFKLSIGKTYLSKDIAVINSVMFQTRTVTQQGGWRRLDWAHVPFYSMSPFGGGQRRSGTPIDWPQEIYKAFMNKRFSSADIKDVLYKIITSDDPEDQRLQLDANLGGVLYIQEILAHMDGPRLTEEDIKSLMSDYVDAPELESQRVFGTRRYGDVAIGTYVRDCLKQAPAGFSRLNYYRLILRDLKPLLKDAGVPWFIPESLGGLGFPCMDCNGELTTVGELAFGPSQLDLMVADQVFNLMTLGKGPRAVRQETPWELHKVVMDRVPRKYVRLVNKNDYEPEEVDLLMKNHQKLYSALVFDAFLHEPTDRLFSSEQSFQSLKSVQHNQEIWRASSYTNLSKRRMRTAEELWHNDGLVEIISARETTSEDKREIRRFLLRLQLGTDYVGTGQVTRDPGWVPIASQEVPASASAVNRLDYPDELEVQGTEYIPSGNDNGIYTFVSPDFRKLVADRDYSYEPDQYTPLYPHYNSDSESDDDEDDAFSVLEIDIARMRQRNWSIDSSIPPGSPAGL